MEKEFIRFDLERLRMINEFEFILRTILAASAGLTIGISRRHQPASLRTFALICMGSALFVLMGLRLGWTDDSNARVLGQVISGIGFLGLGVIWKQGLGSKPHGLTTAAGIWVVAGLGVMIAFGLWIESAVVLVLALAILYSKKTLEKAHLED